MYVCMYMYTHLHYAHTYIHTHAYKNTHLSRAHPPKHAQIHRHKSSPPSLMHTRVSPKHVLSRVVIIAVCYVCSRLRHVLNCGSIVIIVAFCYVCVTALRWACDDNDVTLTATMVLVHVTIAIIMRRACDDNDVTLTATVVYVR